MSLNKLREETPIDFLDEKALDRALKIYETAEMDSSNNYFTKSKLIFELDKQQIYAYNNYIISGAKNFALNMMPNQFRAKALSFTFSKYAKEVYSEDKTGTFYDDLCHKSLSLLGMSNALKCCKTEHYVDCYKDKGVLTELRNQKIKMIKKGS